MTAEQTTLAQLELPALKPANRPRGAMQMVKLEELPADPHTKASGWLEDSVREWGVCEPIVLADMGDAGYAVADGRRRLAAARSIGLPTIPAHVFDAEDVGPYLAQLAVMLNEKRSSNPATNFESVRQMAMDRGYSPEQIGKETGLTVPTVKALLSLTTVHPTILKAMKAGTVKYGVVRLIAKCCRETQEMLVKRILFTRGTIAARDVTEQAPEFAPPPPQPELPEAWKARAVATVAELVGSAPPDLDVEELMTFIQLYEGGNDPVVEAK